LAGSNFDRANIEAYLQPFAQTNRTVFPEAMASGGQLLARTAMHVAISDISKQHALINSTIVANETDLLSFQIKQLG
jgi:hypothetical protein